LRNLKLVSIGPNFNKLLLSKEMNQGVSPRIINPNTVFLYSLSIQQFIDIVVKFLRRIGYRWLSTARKLLKLTLHFIQYNQRASVLSKLRQQCPFLFVGHIIYQRSIAIFIHVFAVNTSLE